MCLLADTVFYTHDSGATRTYSHVAQVPPDTDLTLGLSADAEVHGGRTCLCFPLRTLFFSATLTPTAATVT